MFIDNKIEIRPIRLDEWLPDRCLNGTEPLDPDNSLPGSGCSSLNCLRQNDREALVQLYESVINKYGTCGFVAWKKKKIIAYNNFFPKKEAERIKFYGYGSDSDSPDKTLVRMSPTSLIFKEEPSANQVSN